ncbi:MAG: mercury resistance system transport protein MerF [Gammaproteobacteria bacterium]
MNRKLLSTGLIGFVVAAICCFTPVLVVGMGAIGLSAWLGWLDYVLLPMLAVFLGLIVYSVLARSKGEPQ